MVFAAGALQTQLLNLSHPTLTSPPIFPGSNVYWSASSGHLSVSDIMLDIRYLWLEVRSRRLFTKMIE